MVCFEYEMFVLWIWKKKWNKLDKSKRSSYSLVVFKHSCLLERRISGTGKPGGLTSMGSHRVGYDWSDLAAAAAY